jgi:hypothetical protein
MRCDDCGIQQKRAESDNGVHCVAIGVCQTDAIVTTCAGVTTAPSSPSSTPQPLSLSPSTAPGATLPVPDAQADAGTAEATGSDLGIVVGLIVVALCILGCVAAILRRRRQNERRLTPTVRDDTGLYAPAPVRLPSGRVHRSRGYSRSTSSSAVRSHNALPQKAVYSPERPSPYETGPLSTGAKGDGQRYFRVPTDSPASAYESMSAARQPSAGGTSMYSAASYELQPMRPRRPPQPADTNYVPIPGGR